MRLRFSFAVRTLALCVAFAAGGARAARDPEAHELRYTEPAAEWLEALPIGNGRTGAMVFGGILEERLQFNEQTLVTGSSKTGDNGAYQPFGNLRLTFEKRPEASDYERVLDLDAATVRVSFRSARVRFEREVFASRPDDVIALRLTSSDRGQISFVVRLEDARGGKGTGDRQGLTFQGTLPNGMNYAAGVRVVANGGTVTREADGIRVTTADSATVFLDATTDFDKAPELNFKGQPPLPAITQHLDNAVRRGFDEIRKSHLADHQALYRRCSLDLGHSAESMLPTPKRLAAAARGDMDPALPSLLFHYGRYLLIASSRPGGLPANLQGIWNDSPKPAWNSTYTTNINLQMNYWPAELTGLPECHRPMLDWISNLAAVTAASEDPKLKVPVGWISYSTHNAFGGNTAWALHMPGSAWLSQHLWEAYDFGGSRGFLEHRAYPQLRALSELWLGRLVAGPDGTLITPDGWSPEHGPVRQDDGTIVLKEGDRTPLPGVSYDQQIVHDLFSRFITASAVLNQDAELRAKVETARARMLGPKIGRWGQIQEWMEDVDQQTNKHRHNSHLFAVYPGRQITPDGTPALAEAAKVSLKARGPDSTGWSLAWRMNIWARLHDGDSALECLKRLLKPVPAAGGKGSGTYPNLFGAHPPFQIDSNFGATAGIAEMLLQSHETGTDGKRELRVLPALPKGWKTGSVRGLRARGAFTLDVGWSDGQVIALRIRSERGEAVRIHVNGKVLEPEIAAGSSFQWVR